MGIIATIRSWIHGGPIENSSFAETALQMCEAHKTYMKCSAIIEKGMAAQRADMDAAHARITALREPTIGSAS